MTVEKMGDANLSLTLSLERRGNHSSWCEELPSDTVEQAVR